MFIMFARAESFLTLAKNSNIHKDVLAASENISEDTLAVSVNSSLSYSSHLNGMSPQRRYVCCIDWMLKKISKQVNRWIFKPPDASFVIPCN